MNQLKNSTAVIYARFSSNNQREESIDAQLRICREYAKQHGLNIVSCYTDYAKSATTADRDSFQQMISDSYKGGFRYVIVHKLDRFSRDKYDSVVYKRKLRNNNVRLLSVSENLDDSPESIMLESVLEGMSQYYSQNLAREVKKGQKESALKCLHLGGTPPLGYDIDSNRHYIINEQEAEIVKFIFHQYLNSNGYKQLMNSLNERGYRTKRGEKFVQSSLAKILTNVKYKGTYTFNRYTDKDFTGRRSPKLKEPDEIITIPNGMPAIINEDMFERVQVKLKKNKGHRGKFKANRVYSLSGLIYCGECGSLYHGNYRKNGRGKRDYTSYRCSARLQHKGCTNTEIRLEYIEGYTIDIIKEYLTSITTNSNDNIGNAVKQFTIERTKVIDTTIQNFSQQASEIDSKITEIVRLVSESQISISSVTKPLKELEDEKTCINQALEQHLLEKRELELRINELNDTIYTYSCFNGTLNDVEARNLVEKFVDKVILYFDRVEVYLKTNIIENAEFKPFIATDSRNNIFQKYRVINR